MNLEAAREKLVAHSRSTKNGIFPAHVNFEAKLTNPLCGDHVELKILSDGNFIREIGHRTQACAICAASASLLCEEVQGKSVGEVAKLAETFETTLTQELDGDWPTALLGLKCFEHLRVNPSRRVCALLPWIVFNKAMRSVAGVSR